jgi:hypothetical protein
LHNFHSVPGPVLIRPFCLALLLLLLLLGSTWALFMARRRVRRYINAHKVIGSALGGVLPLLQ